MYLEQNQLEEPLTVENIMDGKVEVTESFKEFYVIPCTGNANAIFACSGGELIPAKHLSLGLTMKSLRGRIWVFY